jgi:tetratricopeptide (TPR) repeat protein
LVAGIVIAYLPVWDAGFIWDDDAYVTGNLTLRNLEGLRRIWLDAAATPQYYPLTFTSFWVDYHLWALNPLGYHLTNVLLQALNAILVWTLLRRLGVRGAWLAAAIFGLHPVNVESVAWVTERKNLLSGFFCLSAALACLRFWLPHEAAGDCRVGRGSPTSAVGLGNWKFYWLGLFLYLCALLAKTATLALPAVIVLVVWWKRGKVRWRELYPLAPFLGVGLALGLITMWVERHYAHAVGKNWAFSAAERCLIAGRAVWFYLGKQVWPHPLIFVYPRWEIHASPLTAYLPGVAAAAGLLLLWRKRNGWARPVLCALACFLALLFPLLGFFNVFYFRYSFVADHFQYLAGIGPLALGAAGITTALGCFQERKPLLQPALCGALLGVLGVLTWQQSGMYVNLETLWQTTIARNPTCSMAHNNLGLFFLQKGQVDAAIGHFQKTLEFQPDDADAHYNLGIALLQRGDADAAMAQFKKALELQPSDADAHNNLGLGLLQRGRVDEAIVHFRKTLELQPDDTTAHNNLGIALLQRGRVNEAIAQFQKALELQPDFAQVHNNLANALLQKGHVREALAHYQRSLEIQPDDARTLSSLARVLATCPEAAIRNGAKAVELAQRANQLSGSEDPMVLRALAAAYAESGRFAEAIMFGRQALPLATAQNDTQLVTALRKEIELYQAGSPFRDSILTDTPDHPGQPPLTNGY